MFTDAMEWWREGSCSKEDLGVERVKESMCASRIRERRSPRLSSSQRRERLPQGEDPSPGTCLVSPQIIKLLLGSN